MITIAYSTNRMDSKLEWFLDSFNNQSGGDHSGFKFVLVDYHRDDPSRIAFDSRFSRIKTGGGEVVHVLPKPTVWQGKNRLTKKNFYAQANARNTALCLAPDGHIVYLDDLSVANSTWLWQVKKACELSDTITCGSYLKAKKMVVENGEILSYEWFKRGSDTRIDLVDLAACPIPCSGGWHYGCCTVAPVEAYLSVNGWPEICDSIGYADCVTGIVMENRGWKFKFDPFMQTIESYEHHYSNEVFTRLNKGVKPNDKAHKIVNDHLKHDRFDNFFGEEGIRGLRDRVLGGGEFPVMTIPDRDWYDNQPICEMQ